MFDEAPGEAPLRAEVPDLVEVLFHRLLPSARQRVCIFSTPELCETRLAQLKTLLGILLLPAPNNSPIGSLVEEAIYQASVVKPPHQGAITTRAEVLAVLEPFLFRFSDEDEDDDEEGDADEATTAKSSSNIASESLLRIEVISNPLTSHQRALHDRILTDRA